ncbi:MAG: D-alanyl-D-alanine endopeptidase [Sulfuritalea sp.]|nr:D-alanyl-D-alanine endopeptidase [Sulfuritalea sp.]
MIGASASVGANPAKKDVSASKKETGKKTVRKAKKPAAKPVRSPVRRAAVSDDGSGSINDIRSSAVAVFDQSTGDVIFEKNAGAVVPIASITKLMTAMVALDVHPNLDETLTISAADLDTLKGTHSRLAVGTQMSREEMLRLALMSSENRATAALSRYYPGGRQAFVGAMNAKARMLGLSDTRFADPTGLSPANVSSARDLVKLVNAAHQYPLIREFSTSEEYQVAVRGQTQMFRNSNVLVRNEQWEIGLSKTGFIREAGKCLVMQAWVNDRPTVIVLLNSWGRLTRIGDANRIKRWVETMASSSSPLRG